MISRLHTDENISNNSHDYIFAFCWLQVSRMEVHESDDLKYFMKMHPM